jgi:hypothetical protein
VTESSGLAASGRHDGVLWTVNDSGDAARIYGVGPDGRTRATLRVAGLEPRDWEALAAAEDGAGRPVLWVGDIGDNQSARERGILVHRVVEPEELRDDVVRPTSFRLVYPDGPHDAETLLVDPRTGRLSVVTKDLIRGGIYAAPQRLDPVKPNVLERVADAPAVVTDGAYVADGRLVLRTYSTAHVYAEVGGPAVEVALPAQPQGETLAADRAGGAVLVGSEGARSVVFRVPLPDSPKPKPLPSAPATSSTPDDRASGPSRGALAGIGLALVGGAAVAALGLRARRRR